MEPEVDPPTRPTAPAEPRRRPRPHRPRRRRPRAIGSPSPPTRRHPEDHDGAGRWPSSGPSWGWPSSVALGLGLLVARPWVHAPTCPPVAQHPEWSVARRWDEALLDAIRRALPNPPVHARNLFHTSAAMWDAWAAYDPTATGYFVKEKHSAPDVAAARNEAISYAAYRVLTARFIKAVGGPTSLSEFDDVMDSLCYPLDVTTTEGDSPAALGNRIAKTILAYGLTDGSNQANGYVPTRLQAGEPAARGRHSPGTTMTDPNRWQPLQIEHMISQNGIPVTNGVQQAVGPDWGHVTTLRLAAGRRRRRRPDRPRAPARARRSGDRPGVQGPGRRGHPRQQPARPDRAPRRSTSRPAPAATTTSGRTTARPPGQPGHRPAVPAGRRQRGRLRPGHGRVLGRRPQVGDAAGPLERAGQPRLATSSPRTSGSAAPVRPSTGWSGT